MKSTGKRMVMLMKTGINSRGEGCLAKSKQKFRWEQANGLQFLNEVYIEH